VACPSQLCSVQKPATQALQGFVVWIGFAGHLTPGGSAMVHSSSPKQRYPTTPAAIRLLPYSFCDCTQSGCLLRDCMMCMQPCKTQFSALAVWSQG
jgi:hypothetical protein